MKNIADLQHFVGCDVSKSTLDFALYVRGTNPHLFPVLHTSNSLKGYAELVKWLKSNSVSLSQVAIGMEHTGPYSQSFAEWLASKSITYAMLNPLAVKRSCATSRVKTDKADAQMIADYVYTQREKLEPSKPLPKALKELAQLRALRAELVKSRTALLNMKDMATSSSVRRLLSENITVLTASIAQTDRQIRKCVDAHKQTSRAVGLLLTVPGIGMVNAIDTVIATAGFTRFRNARQYAKYVCVAPLVCESGTSVRRGTHVSTLGNRTLKGNLTCAARSAITHDKALRRYYQRKRQEGKAHGTVMNAVKFKIICRMFAVIKRGTPYVELQNYFS